MLSIIFWLLWAFYAMIAMRWARGLYDLSRAPLGGLLTPALPHRAPRVDDPTLTVLVAAHNEGDNIADCLDRLRQQNYRLSQIIIINDRSSDATGQVIQRLAAHDPRIEPVEVSHLPEGWIGKTHALSLGAKKATGDYLLFIDSDVYLKPGAIAAVMDKAVAEKADFLTLWPRLGLRSLADRLLVPATGWLLSFWSWAGGGVGRATTHPVIGNGQFLLVRREPYERIGGHAAVRAELAEDAMLAANAYRAQLNRWVGFGTGLYVASRNSSFRRCANGLARVLIGSLITPWKVFASTQIVLGACVTPFWIGPLAAILWGMGFNPWLCGAFVATAVVHIVAMFGTLRRLFSFTLEERGSLLWFPLGCVCTVGILVWSLLIMSGRGTIRWGATRYTVRGSQILAPVGDSH